MLRRCCVASKFRVKANCENVHRSAAGVVCRVLDALIVARQPDAFVDAKAVKTFENGFRLVIQGAITDEKGNPTTVGVIDNTGVTGMYQASNGLKGDAVWGTRNDWVLLTGTSY